MGVHQCCIKGAVFRECHAVGRPSLTNDMEDEITAAVIAMKPLSDAEMYGCIREHTDRVRSTLESKDEPQADVPASAKF